MKARRVYLHASTPKIEPNGSSLIQFGRCDGKVANWIRHVSGSQAALLPSAYAPLSRTTAA
jgi:hypothetical protein